MTMKRITLWLEEETLEKLKKEQKENKIKYFSDVIRIILEVYLE